ncbi:hypothetical protein B0H17DRAFT_1131862 [Mycena rosella]|uniref:Uncharacterized protein n=1 Tax=Mycena rosella TaxID=1033263 RepID=A0AAD7DM45_MYCRO|nr:hypothetical protein B0H17DRAFT_1131862 [Mycena rosella]
MAKATTPKVDTYARPQAPAKWIRELVADVGSRHGARELADCRCFVVRQGVSGSESLRGSLAPVLTGGDYTQVSDPPNSLRPRGFPSPARNASENMAPRATQSGSQINSGAQLPRSRPPTQPEKERLNDRRQSGAQAAHSGAPIQPPKDKLSERISTHIKESGSQRYSGSQGAPSTSFTQSGGKTGRQTQRSLFNDASSAPIPLHPLPGLASPAAAPLPVTRSPRNTALLGRLRILWFSTLHSSRKDHRTPGIFQRARRPTQSTYHRWCQLRTPPSCIPPLDGEAARDSIALKYPTFVEKGLSARQRQGFLDSIAPKYLTFVEKVEIADLLETHLDNTATGFRPVKIQAVSIPRPPEGLVNVLGQHTCSYVHIKKHMRIADDNEYFDIVDYIESEIPRFLEVEKLVEEQDDLQVQTVIESPIPGRPASRPTRNAAQRTRTPSSQPPRHECPRQRMYPAADVPPSVAALLADYGIEELGPAFLFLGVQTDEKFASMVASEKARSRFLAGAPPLQLGVRRSKA